MPTSATCLYAVITRLDHFGFLSISGRDAVSFLQGYTTCDVDKLAAGTPLVGAICNIQGRMVSSFRLAQSGDDLLLRMHRDLVAPTMAFLGKYIVFSKAEMSDLSDHLACYGADGVSEELSDAIIIDLDDGRAEIWTADSLTASGDASAWETQEIAAGLAWVGPETTEQFIPQMFNYHAIDAIDFDKGCYLGQEIVARMQYRGELKRRLYASDAGTHVSTRIGDTLNDESGSKLGEVVASAGGRCLAVLRGSDDQVTAVSGDGSITPLALVT